MELIGGLIGLLIILGLIGVGINVIIAMITIVVAIPVMIFNGLAGNR